MAVNWARDRRLDWIDDRLTSGATLNRSDLTAYFGISAIQASLDISAFRKTDPHMVYDPSAKHYTRRDPHKGKSVRYSTPLRRAAWDAWPRPQPWCPDAEDHAPGNVCWECQR